MTWRIPQRLKKHINISTARKLSTNRGKPASPSQRNNGTFTMLNEEAARRLMLAGRPVIRLRFGGVSEAPERI
jgi:hypothetical protein